MLCMFFKIYSGSSSSSFYIIFLVNNTHVKLNLRFDLGNLEPLNLWSHLSISITNCFGLGLKITTLNYIFYLYLSIIITTLCTPTSVPSWIKTIGLSCVGSYFYLRAPRTFPFPSMHLMQTCKLLVHNHVNHLQKKEVTRLGV
jgi:hypothetical protein